MIDLFYWPTPNGHKITLFLEEAELPYTIKPINIGKGEQFAPDFLAFSPNNRMPAIIDHAPVDGGAPVSVFESARSCCISPRRPGASCPPTFAAAYRSPSG
jgi:GST-like protein